ncbi:MAG: putative competence-damage inducible protein [Hyphomicrobiaceae bacterium hypho_1]
MRCEIVAIGTELLLGIIPDTNSSWISEQLALNGIDSHFQAKVGDNPERIEACLRIALERSDVVICCGGLGPTQDDITRNVLAKIMGAEMRQDETIVAELKKRFAAKGQEMPINNLCQADIPIGASIMGQMPGTAPGLICPIKNKIIYAVPGVPHEMRAMVEGTVLPDMRKHTVTNGIIRSRTLRTWGISESRLAELLQERIDDLDRTNDATLAFQASGIDGIKIRITTKANCESEAIAKLEVQDSKIRPILGSSVFGIDNETMECAVLKLLQKKGLTLAVAETLTGGLLSARMTHADPKMKTFIGGCILSNIQLPDCAQQMEIKSRAINCAEYARKSLGADVSISALEPTSNDMEPAGTVITAITTNKYKYSNKLVFHPIRENIRKLSVISLLDELRKALISNQQWT